MLRAPETAGPLLAGHCRPAARVPRKARVPGARPGALSEPESRGLLAASGFALPAHVVATSRAGAARAAADGRAKAMKLSAPGLVHRSEVGGVRLNVTGKAATARAFDALMAGAPDGAAVQVTDMIPGDVDCVMGAFRDEQFGPVVMFGLGGIAVEALDDVVFRLAPLSRSEAREMLDAIRARVLLGLHRGRALIDRRAAVDLLFRLFRLVVAAVDIAEIDLNPVFLGPDGARIADARIVIAG